MTMQNVAWPITIVQYVSPTPQNVKNELRAIPVMIPGSAIGRTTRNDTASRPKKRKRLTPKAAAEPSRIAIVVATSPARTDSQSASRMPWSLKVFENHFVDSPEIGQPCTFDGLNA